VSGLLMLVVTIWMFAKDHTREWKPIQATQRRIDQFYLAGRISEAETAKHAQIVSEAEDQLAEIRSTPLDPKQVAAFQAAAEGFDFASFDADTQRLTERAAAARAAEAEAKQAREKASRLLEAA